MFKLNGYEIHVKNPVPSYKYVVMDKKHRKKRNKQPRVKVFSHWIEMIPDGEVIQDNIHNAFYMNSKTFDQLKRSI